MTMHDALFFLLLYALALVTSYVIHLLIDVVVSWWAWWRKRRPLPRVRVDDEPRAWPSEQGIS